MNEDTKIQLATAMLVLITLFNNEEVMGWFAENGYSYEEIKSILKSLNFLSLIFLKE